MPFFMLRMCEKEEIKQKCRPLAVRGWKRRRLSCIHPSVVAWDRGDVTGGYPVD
jgi:hypothetical protein